jgi:hypothetical protein
MLEPRRQRRPALAIGLLPAWVPFVVGRPVTAIVDVDPHAPLRHQRLTLQSPVRVNIAIDDLNRLARQADNPLEVGLI